MGRSTRRRERGYDTLLILHFPWRKWSGPLQCTRSGMKHDKRKEAAMTQILMHQDPNTRNCTEVYQVNRSPVLKVSSTIIKAHNNPRSNAVCLALRAWELPIIMAHQALPSQQLAFLRYPS